MQKKFYDFLEKFGLTEIETDIYLALLQIGPSSVLELAKHTGQKRTTVHINVESLISKGMVSQTKAGARRKIIAESPENLTSLIEEKKRELSQIEATLPAVVETLQKLSPEKGGTKADVRYFEGEKSVRLFYDQVLRADELRSFADLENYYQVYPNTQELWEKALEQNTKRTVLDILVDTQLARQIVGQEHFDRYKAKFLPKHRSLEKFKFSDYLIFGHKVGIVRLDPGGVSATLIDSEPMSETLKALHQIMWDLLP